MPDGPNLQLFVDTLAHIERDPAAWDQEVWMNLGIEGGKICATSGCMAGWVCLIAGKGHPNFMPHWVTDLERGDKLDSSLWKMPTGDTIDIDSYATQLLGIDKLDEDGDEARDGGASDILFSGSNGMDDLYSNSARVLKMDEKNLREQVATRVTELDRAAIRRARLAHAVSIEKENGNA
jgi:hypothetical protein